MISVKSDSLLGAIKDKIALTIAKIKANITTYFQGFRFFNNLFIEPKKSLDFSFVLGPGLGIF